VPLFVAMQCALPFQALRCAYAARSATVGGSIESSSRICSSLPASISPA